MRSPRGSLYNISGEPRIARGGRATTFALIGVGLFAISAFWVTAAHNAAHRQKLDELAAAEQRNRRAPPR